MKEEICFRSKPYPEDWTAGQIVQPRRDPGAGDVGLGIEPFFRIGLLGTLQRIGQNKASPFFLASLIVRQG